MGIVEGLHIRNHLSKFKLELGCNCFGTPIKHCTHWEDEFKESTFILCKFTSKKFLVHVIITPNSSSFELLNCEDGCLLIKVCVKFNSLVIEILFEIILTPNVSILIIQRYV